MQITSYLLIFSNTLLASALLVATQAWHGKYSMDGTEGVQKHHTIPTPRVGGLALMMGLCTAWMVAEKDVKDILCILMLAGLPAFGFGLLEDLTKKVSVSARLVATMFSGFLAWLLTGVSMQDTGLPPLDYLLHFAPVAVLFTAFAVGGVANAVNLIDGFNGLAAGSVAIMLCAMGVLAANLSDAPVATACFALVACSVGFGVVNWPLGKLFLGDGGAYLLGFIVAWLAVLLTMRHVDVHAWATLLICAYPVLEVGFSIRRRRNRVGRHPGQPDKIHLHHLVHRRIICKLFPNLPPALKNGLTSPLCWLATALPAVWAVVFAKNTLMLTFALCAFTLLYAAVYSRLTQFHWWFRADTPDEPIVVESAVD